MVIQSVLIIQLEDENEPQNIVGIITNARATLRIMTDMSVHETVSTMDTTGETDDRRHQLIDVDRGLEADPAIED